MAIRLTTTSSLILGPILLLSGLVLVAAGAELFRSVMFCVIGALLLVGGLVRLGDRGGDDVASAKLQRRRRERFGQSRKR